MKVICGVLVFCTIQMGCSSSYEVSSSPNADSSFNAFNVEASDRSATIVFQDGRESGVRNIIASPDSTRFLNEKTDAITVVPTPTIQKVVFKKRSAGFLEGLWIGPLVGVPAGVGLVVFGMPKGEGESYVIAAVFVGGLVGGLIGGISGFVIGHSYEYQFPTSADSTKK